LICDRLLKTPNEKRVIIYFTQGKRRGYARRMNEILSWALVIGAVIALVALGFNALQVVSSGDEFWIARGWFTLAALVALANHLLGNYNASQPCSPYRSYYSLLWIVHSMCC
jgi:hypothetical protein